MNAIDRVAHVFVNDYEAFLSRRRWRQGWHGTLSRGTG